MIVSFNQPAFIPWGGFFCRLLASERMVLLDDTLFARGFTFVNRNRLKGLQGETWVTVPVKKRGRGRQKIRDLEIFEKAHWAKKFLAALSHLYGKSVYYDEVSAPLAAILDKGDHNFLNMAKEILESLKSNLNIATPFVLQSELGITGQGTLLLVKIAEQMKADGVILPYPARSLVDWRQFEKQGIAVSFLKFVCPVYPQFRGDFIPCLSALDLLYSLGRDSRTLLEESFSLVTSDL